MTRVAICRTCHKLPCACPQDVIADVAAPIKVTFSGTANEVRFAARAFGGDDKATTTVAAISEIVHCWHAGIGDADAMTFISKLLHEAGT